jgi:hypothetical protein
MVRLSARIRTAALFHTVSACSIAAVLLAATSCSKDNPAAPPAGAGDPENISRVTITLTPAGGGTAVTSFIQDPDGTQLPQPPAAPSATLALTPGVTYNGTIELLNDIDPSNVINITDEVHEEGNFHRFFYTITANAETPRDSLSLPTPDASRKITIPVSSLDKDTQSPTPQPLGITFQVLVDATAPSGATTLNVQLHHFEEAKGDGLGKTFDTDLDVSFPVQVP